MVSRTILARLQDILDSIIAIQQAVRQAPAERIFSDAFFRFGIERGPEVITEASRHIPESYKDRHPDVPWRNIKTIGNVLRHEYERIEPAIIWEVATEHLTVLNTQSNSSRPRSFARARSPI
jgi:uncharacterized protein with HEPN domain